MTPSDFEYFLNKIAPKIHKQDTVLRTAISCQVLKENIKVSKKIFFIHRKHQKITET